MGNNIIMDNKKFLYNKCKLLPTSSGVYLMKSVDGEIIYIGKAKNLKNRISSYFSSSLSKSPKVNKMIENINHFEYVITDSEFEALILECSLIKKYQPKYNILLKDDKGYSYIKITNQTWPRINYVKQKLNDNSTYIGPYTNTFSIRKLVIEVSRIFKLPDCSRNLENIYKRPCLNFYIDRCCAPCTREISCINYNALIKEAVNFLKNGKYSTIKKLTKEMHNASEKMDFESAAKLRDRIRALENIKETQKIVSYRLEELDVIATARNEEHISIEIFKFKKGDLYKVKGFIIDFQDDLVQARTEFIKQNYCLKNEIPSIIALDGDIEDKEIIEKLLISKTGKSVKIIIPKKGEDLKLVKMCKSNAYENLLNISTAENKYDLYLENLKNVLNLEVTPKYIEAYDISNLFGSDCVGALAVFKDGQPFKAAYRKFKIHSNIHQDDYKAMQEVIMRRFSNLDKYNYSPEKNSLPNIILVDGGMTHVAAVQRTLDQLGFSVPVFGMVKDSRHRTRALTTDHEEIEIKNNSRLFAFITSIQDEVHRYAINYHKKLRNKRICKSELTKIKGIGPAREKALLKAFGSLKCISRAQVEQLKEIKGMNLNLAKTVYDYFHSYKS